MTPLRNPGFHREDTRKLCYKVNWHNLIAQFASVFAVKAWISEGSHYQAIYCDYGLCRAPGFHREDTRKLCYKVNWHPLTNIEDAIEGDIQDYQAIYCDYGLCRAILGGEKVKFGRFGGRQAGTATHNRWPGNDSPQKSRLSPRRHSQTVL
jgi:hypothetical protein